MRRFVPEGGKFAETDAQRRYGDIRYKAWTAREKGREGAHRRRRTRSRRRRAQGLEGAGRGAAAVARAGGLRRRGHAGRRGQARGRQPRASSKLAKKQKPMRPSSRWRSTADEQTRSTWWRARRRRARSGKACRASSSSARTTITSGRAGAIRSRPTSDEPHVGADDNALGHGGAARGRARARAAKKSELQPRRRVHVVLGRRVGRARLDALHASDRRGGRQDVKDVVAMLNMDMVGRMRDNRVQRARQRDGDEWKALVAARVRKARVECATERRRLRAERSDAVLRGGRAGAALLHRSARATTTSPPTPPTRSTPPARRRSRWWWPTSRRRSTPKDTRSR